jgi:uncharacterized protein
MSAAQVDSAWLRAELIASWREIIAVLLFMIGEPAYASAKSALHGSSSYYSNFFLSNYWLSHNMVWESTMLALTLGFLHWRGWTSADFKIKPSWWSSLHAIILWLAMKLGYALVFFGMILIIFFFQYYTSTHGFLGLKGGHVKIHSGTPNWLLVIVSNIINAYSEEITCMGYAFCQFSAKCGPLFALLLTVALRMLCHTYQGLMHMFAVGAIFLVGGAYYCRTRNLWPLIFAHVLFDAVPIVW